MSKSLDGLVRLRQLIFDRMTTCTSQAASEVTRAREILDLKRNELASIGDKREEASRQLWTLGDARWLGHFWAFDLRLAEDSLRARREMSQTESDLTGRREDLSKCRTELALARARLQIAQNLVRRRGRAGARRRERRSGPEVQPGTWVTF